MQFVFQGEIRVRMKAASLERHHVSDFRPGLDRETSEFRVSDHRCGLSIWALLGGYQARILPGRYVSLPEIAFFTRLLASPAVGQHLASPRGSSACIAAGWKVISNWCGSLNTVEALLGML